MKSIKITIFISSISGGGAERVICNLANELVKNFNVDILTMSQTKNVYGLNKKVNYINLLENKDRKGFINNNIKRYVNLQKYINITDTTVYLVMLPITTILLLHFRSIINAPIIVAERNNPSSYSIITKILLKKYFTMADGWIFQTPQAKKWYSHINKEYSIIIPNAVNSEFIRIPYNGKKNYEIVSVGRLTTQKNFQLLLTAFSIIAKKHINYRLIIYGKGPLENILRKKSFLLGLSDRIEFRGYVDKIAEKIESASMFVLSSKFEGMPNALIEAMALGLPCVSTACPCGGPEYLIQNNKNGILVPVNDANKMAEAIDRVLSDDEYSKHLSKNAQMICEKLSHKKIYKKWEQYILHIVNDWYGK